MNVARRLVSGSAMRVITLVSGIGIGLYVLPLMIHALGDRDFGLWTVVSVVVGYHGMLDFGLSQALGRYLAVAMAGDDRDECNRLFNTGLVMYSLLGLVVLAIASAVAAASPWIWSEPGDAERFAPLLLILGLNLAISFPVRAFGGVLQATLRFDLASRFGFVTLLLLNGGIIWTLESGLGLMTLAWVTLAAGLPEKLMTAWFALREMPWLQPSFRAARRGSARTLFSFSVYIFVQRVSQMLRFQMDSVLLTAFVGLGAVTHYRVAFSLIRYYRQLMSALFGVMLPVFSRQHGRGDVEALERSLLFSLRLSVGISSFVAFALIAWGHPFISRWVGPEYLDAYPCLVALALGSLFGLWQSTFPTALLSSGRERMAAALAATEGVCNLAVSLLLVQWYGMFGVALGTLIPHAVVRLLLQPALGAPAMGLSYRRYLRELGTSAAMAAICLVPGLLLTLRLSEPDYFVLAGLAAATGLAFAPGYWWLGLRPSDRRAMLALIRPRGDGRGRRMTPDTLNEEARPGGEGHG
jgi:O-antigen/teichoic acid export membrane protein